MRAGTIVASNYLAMAAVLGETFLQHHPDSTFVVLVVDGDRDDLPTLPEGIEIATLDQLDLSEASRAVMRTIYDVMEFSTSVKPSFLRLLLQGDDPVACYLDPDIIVYAPFDDQVAPAVERGIVLTPHVLQPVPRDGMKVSEGTIMQSGMFNCGFVAVSAGGRPFLDWWDVRLRFDADVDFEASHFTDQRWVDWVPSLFDHHVSFDPTMNVAWWNVHERDFEVIDGVPTLDGAILRFVHFSGYDPQHPDLLSKHQVPSPRVAHTVGTPMRTLADDYGRRLFASGHVERRAQPYGWSVSVDGVELSADVRRAVRAALVDEVGEDVTADHRTVPDAFGGGVGSLRDWLIERAAREEREQSEGPAIEHVDTLEQPAAARPSIRARATSVAGTLPSPPPVASAAARRVADVGDRLAARLSVRRAAASASSTAERRPFAFLHIPKSAGSAVTAALRGSLPDHRWYDGSFDESMLGQFRGVPTPAPLSERILSDLRELDGVDAAAGHFSLPTLRHRFDDVDVALVVREPRARLLSHYEYWRGLPEELHEDHLPWTDSRSAVDADFVEWLVDPAVIHQTDNVLVRYLLADHPDIPETAEIPHDRMRGLAGEAVKRARRLGWVGTVEGGDATWVSLGERVGAPLAMSSLNVTERRDDRPTDLGAVLSERSTHLLAARTAGDSLVWSDIARRTGFGNPTVAADAAWHQRLATSVRTELG